MSARFLAVVALAAAFGVVRAEEPCKSGLLPPQRPGPYSCLVAVGPERGQQHCYVCDAGDRPVVIVFARTLSAPLGKLASGIDGALAAHKSAELRGWVTFLAEDETALDPKIVQWSKVHAIKNVPIGIFEDMAGPPAYRIARDADVTVLLSVKQRVVANFAFRSGELNDAAVDAVLKAIPKVAGAKK